MTSRKLKKKLHEHPFLADRCFALSNAQASSLIAEHGYPNIERIIVRAKSKMDWPPESWAELDALVAARSRAGQMSHARPARTVRFSARFAVICLILLMLAGFFGFVPAGRALAEQIYSAVMYLIDNLLVIEVPESIGNRSEFGAEIPENVRDAIAGSEQTQDANPTVIEDETIDAFIAATGRSPIVLSQDWLTLQTVEYSADDTAGCVLVIQYGSDRGAPVTTTQMWDISVDMFASSNNGSFKQYAAPSGVTVYYTTDAVDHSIYSTAVIDGTVLIICAEEDVGIEQVLKLYDAF
jgi:hypothetical protein